MMEPRRDQLKLLDFITQQNGILYLPTSVGKTCVAILAIRRFSYDLNKSISSGGKRIIFMTNTIELARQQAIEVRKCTNFKVGFYGGERKVDFWSHQKWNTEIEENQILFGTADIFFSIVMRKILKINNLSLIIIDECYAATEQHPMHEFIRLFQYTHVAELPRVIGLTDILFKENKLHNIKKELENLEATYGGNIVTVENLEQCNNLLIYENKPKEEIVSFQLVQNTCNMSNIITQQIDDTLKLVNTFELGDISFPLPPGLDNFCVSSKKNAIQILLKDFLFQMEEYGFYAASIAIIIPITEIEIMKRQAKTLALRQLYQVVITKCENIRHMLMRNLFGELNHDTCGDLNKIVTMDIILNFSTPKLRLLFEQMSHHFGGKTADDIKCMMYVERSCTAKCLYFVVKKFVELTPVLCDVIRPQFMVDHNTISTKIATILNEKWNNSAIDSFRKKECNVIICSNMLEIDIDIQACNYVFTLDPLKTFNSYIQTKGRTHNVNSVYTIFTPKSDEMKIVHEIENYQKIHEIIKSHLIGRILDRDDTKEEHIDGQFVDIIKPFKTTSDTILLPSAALSLVDQYCQKLPSDLFGIAQPRYSMAAHPTTNKRVVALQLPMQSMVREMIYSDSMDTVKDMRVSAAFNACKKLYEKGELNEKMLPLTKQECLIKVSDDLFQHWSPNDDNTCLDVLAHDPEKQQCRLYDRMCPEQLYNAMPIVNETCYAYELLFTTSTTEDRYSSFIGDMLKVTSSYALLLRRPLPRLAGIPLFMNHGKLSVRIAETPIECHITNSDDLQQLCHFHLMLFRDLLEVWKKFFVFDNRNKENSYLLVPLTAVTVEQPLKDIDWQLVRNFQRLPPLRTYSVKERQEAIYRPEEFLGRVIGKWYSGENDRYVVTAVRTDLNIRSKFDDGSVTYEEFTTNRYGKGFERIAQPQQFLLEVCALTNRRNFFIDAVGKLEARHSTRSVIRLIPELCHNFMYPGDMWLKALFLPSVLHRLHYLLHAETLRCHINQYLKLPLTADDQYRPREITVDRSLKRVIDKYGDAIEELGIKEKKMICPLPPKERYSDFSVCSLMAGVKLSTWETHLEPIDYGRHIEKIYAVELNYYWKFLKSQAFILEHRDEVDWTKSQLDMTISPPQHDVAKEQSSNDNDSRVYLTDKCPIISILERSINASSDWQTVEQYEFLTAITTSRSSDVFELDRLQLLGNSFLMFAVTLYLVNKYQNFHVGFLNEIKSRVVCERNVLYCMLVHDIPKRIYSTLFSPKLEFKPPLAVLPYNVLALLEKHPKLISHVSPGHLFSLELNETEVLSGMCDNDQLKEFLSGCTHYGKMVDNDVDLFGVYNEAYIFLDKVVMQDKMVADTLEALLGVCVKNYGIHRAFHMLEFFGVCRAKDGEKPLSHLLDLELGSALLRTNISIREVDGFLINREKLEENLGYTFKNRAYLLQALTHPSFRTNRLTGCYQELEFIGEAMLDFLVSCYIFEQNESMNPGQLTDLRSSLVNNTTLGCVCVRHRFHLFLLAENSLLNKSIKNFADFVETQGFRVTDEMRVLVEEHFMAIVQEDNQEGGCIQKKKINLAVNVDVPKALGDIVEALIAAVYLDSRDLVQTWHVVHKLLEPELSAFSMNVPLDPVRELCEHKSANPNFSHPVVDDEVVMVKCTFACLDQCIDVNGYGKDIKQAKKSAAKLALKILATHSKK